MTHSIPLADIDAAIIALDTLRKQPSRWERPYYDALVALDRIIGNDALRLEIEDMEYDLGLVPVECLACGRDCNGACDAAYEETI